MVGFIFIVRRLLICCAMLAAGGKLQQHKDDELQNVANELKRESLNR
jgi:hypothetical protein